MNQTVEKWLMIGAIVGWVASIGGLVGLAIRTASPAIASRPVQTSSLPFVSRNSLEVYRFDTQVNRAQLNQPSSNLLTIQQESSVTKSPVDTLNGDWVDWESSNSAKWMSHRSR
ncbi:MAG: hypothetical protein C4288_06010 [Leptolyngbya sp. ERB_1_1]